MRTQSVTVKKASENSKHNQPIPSQYSKIKKSNVKSNGKDFHSYSLADLNQSDKQKVVKIVEKLVSLGKDYEHLLEHIEDEKQKKMKHLNELEGQLSIIEDREILKDKEIDDLKNKFYCANGLLVIN